MTTLKRASVGFIGGAALLALALNGGPAFAAATIGSVTPSTGLANGDTVTVQVTGLDPAKSYVVGQCKDFATPPAGSPVCNFTPGSFAMLKGSATGTASLKVNQTFNGGHGGAATSVNCKGVGADQCVVAVVEHPVGGPPAGPLEVAKTAISFG